jgi:hypothetical protein
MPAGNESEYCRRVKSVNTAREFSCALLKRECEKNAHLFRKLKELAIKGFTGSVKWGIVK